MKQRLLILAAATAVAFAACNGGNNQEGSYTKAQLDSITTAKTDSAAAALKAQNDSAINAKAADEARKADSLRVIDSVIAATKKSSSTTTTVIKKSGNGGIKKTTTKKENVEESSEPATIGRGKPAMGDNQPKKEDNNTIGRGKPKM
ncbi:hypothetical protein [Taibaiella koreensis]|uniref:hypothetical protein n=1 Tax=Taibaiella koreensis TaxID=1268548 RepID=UPI000E59D5F9|nr:hypothetical protein [Taibaiella koreensis]